MALLLQQNLPKKLFKNEITLNLRDMALLEELTMDWCPNGLMHDYVWQKIKVAGQ